MAAEATRRLMVFGLDVKDAELYRRYRAEMMPILERHGGAFGYDFVVAQVLRSPTPTPINRVFTIVFPDRAAADRFFTDPAYLAVREAWFTPAVGSVTTIADLDEPVAR